MKRAKSPSLDGLNLSWPHSVNYHVDIAEAETDSLDGGRGAKPRDTGGQQPVATYNGVPREDIRNAQPLFRDEIRVLDLHQGARGMPLVGSLRKVRLSDHTVYEPLSYTWEDCDSVQHCDGDIGDDMSQTLILSDSECSSLELTANCAKALRSVRKPGEDRNIWVDAICVNQDDPEERSHQVDLMKKIYARAFTVLVYLGRESSQIDSSSSMAMKLLGQPDRLQLFHQLDQFEIESLKRLFERRYFRRMWIVQEVALAQNLELHCGPNISYMSKFAGKPLGAILGAQVTPPWLRHSKQADKKVSNVPRSQAEQILELVFDTALCDCKDDRDRIFALFSLLDPSFPEKRLRADYNLSTAQVFSGLAAYLAMNCFLREVLVLAPRLAMHGCPGLPSWVPDWNNIGKAGLHHPKYLKTILSMYQYYSKPGQVRIASSGVITIHGRLLGSVTNTGHSRDYLFIHDRSRLAELSLAGDREPNGCSPRQGDTSTWTLAKLSNEESLSSVRCHFKFFTSCAQSSNANHQAFVLPDYQTLLILRPHDNFRDQYTLVEAGKPLIGAELPDEWKVDPDVVPLFHLNSLKPMDDLERSYWEIIRSSREAFPRLSDFPYLWSHNPFTSSISLTHKAVHEIRRINMSDLDLLRKWRGQVHVGMQILRDNAQLEELIDEVKDLEYEEYYQREKAAGLPTENLTPDWSLADFLSLFKREPYVQMQGHQPTDEIGALEQAAPESTELEINPLLKLMQSAGVTGRVLKLLSEDIYIGFHWPGLSTDTKLYSDAQAVGNIQISCEFRSRDRTSFLLRNILRQLPKEGNPESEQDDKPHLVEKCHWDWGRFMTIMEQRLSFLGHIEPDVRRIQAILHDFNPDSQAIIAHHVLSAHGLDPRKEEFAQIQIR